MEEKKKKDNAFVRWTEKHAEFWKFIKFNCAGAYIAELIQKMLEQRTSGLNLKI